MPTRKDGGAARHSSRRDSLKSPRREEAGSSMQKAPSEPGAQHPGRAGRMRTPVPTDRVRNGVRTQAERIHSQRLKTQVRNGVKGEPSTGEGSDSNSHFNTSMHRM